MDNKTILTSIANYYTEKIKTYGPSVKGVDWNSAESQELRFTQLIKLIEANVSGLSIIDYGCGYGALYHFLNKTYPDKFSYLGYDISREMIEQAELSCKGADNTKFSFNSNQLQQSDYVLASGILNVRLKTSDEEWVKYIIEVLHELDLLSIKGFAFNMLTSYSDPSFMKDYLYYANPSFFFDYCKTNFSKYVSLYHDYPLYEFTIIVKK